MIRVIMDKKAKRKMLKLAVLFAILLQAGTAYAAPPTSADINEKFRPMIRLMQDLANPFALGMMIYGGLRYILGSTSEGKKMATDAFKGYVGIQMMPWLFDFVRDIFR